MKFITALLAALTLAFGMAPAAQAQYYDPYGRPYYPQQRPYYPSPNPFYSPRAVHLGFMCATSRGSCELYQGAPVNSPCRCNFNGLRKRGIVQ
jgi:hypothetical protein